MDKIYLENLEFFAYHGLLSEEKEKGQKFIISVVLEADLSKASVSDDLADTIDYGAVYADISKVVTEERFDLLERLCGAVADVILAKYPVCSVKVKVDKPKAPGFDGPFYAAVEITRTKGV